ncbi:MAG: hypothetical protein ACREGA_00310 [Candidatus Saccharimonadales bacterium]
MALAASASSQVLASSGDPGVHARWYSLSQYGAIRGNVNWPSRSDKCGGVAGPGGQMQKILPYQPEYRGDNGDTFNQSSNCSNRYFDAGSSSGAWLSSGTSLGGWGTSGGNLGGVGSGFSSKLDGCSSYNNATAIWPSNYPYGTSEDPVDQMYTGEGAPGLYYQNYPRGARAPDNVYSNGIGLFQESFTITPADLADIKAGGATFEGIADDWARLYINGTPTAAESNSTAANFSLNLASYLSLLNTGPGNTNTIGIEAIDKAVTGTSDPGSRGSGLCYNLVAGNGNVMPPIPPPTTINCPGDPRIATNTIVTIPLPNTFADDSGKSGATTIPNDQYTQRKKDGQTKINSVNDLSSTAIGGSAVALTSKPPAGTKGAFTSATVDYTPFVNTYPYDHNQASISYQDYYTKTNWYSSSSPDYYTCNGGDTLNGTFSTCHHYTHYTATNVFSTQFQCTAFDAQGNCISGFNFQVFDFSYCNAGDTGGGGQNATCTHLANTYTGQPWYDWHQGVTPATDYVNTESDANGYNMNACFNRTYDLVPQDGTSNINDPENPTQATYNGSVKVKFDESEDGPAGKNLRVASEVSGIDTHVTVSVFHQTNNGSIVASGTYGGTVSPNLKSSYGPYGTGSTATGTVGVSWNFPVSLPPLKYGDKVCFDLSTNPSHGTISTKTPWGHLAVNSAGGRVATVGMRAQPNPPPASTCSTYTHAEPYLKVFGGDAVAGTTTAAGTASAPFQCTNSSAPIAAFNRDAAGGYAGAGTQLAAFAAAAIDQFASSQNSGPGPPTGLTFSNTNSSPYGGYFGASSSDCGSNYYATGQTNPGLTTLPSGSLTGAINGCSGHHAYQVAGGTISGATIPLGCNIAIYSSGAITISGDITYGGVTSQLSQMPNLEIITDGGDINIDNNVGKLAGQYVAENGGTINDCAGIGQADWFYDPPPDGSAPKAQTCGDTNLVVNGSLVASSLTLHRTAYDSAGDVSTIHLASPGAGPSFGAKAASVQLNNQSMNPIIITAKCILSRGGGRHHGGGCSSGGGGSGGSGPGGSGGGGSVGGSSGGGSGGSGSGNSAAEEFDYSPSVWLTYPNQKKGPTVQAITSLPPIL